MTHTGQETILLADDQEMILRLGQGLLERHGYRELTVPDGDQAVEVYRQRMHEIDLVILDLSMPGLSGQEALRELRRLNPSVGVLFSSASLTDLSIEDVDPGDVTGLLAKPYQVAELLPCVRAALEKVRGQGTSGEGGSGPSGAP
jgi:two-component system cell cycle sensor histidine kinase/response regulator CckA